jgi:GTP-binding protein HflX
MITRINCTLEEAKDADLLLHVIDVTDDRMLPKIKAVEEVLSSLHCEDVPTLYALNKIDLLKKKPKIPRRKAFKEPIFISAITKEGVNKLKTKIAEKLTS